MPPSLSGLIGAEGHLGRDGRLENALGAEQGHPGALEGEAGGEEGAGEDTVGGELNLSGQEVEGGQANRTVEVRAP